jgi:hypothetical protein
MTRRVRRDGGFRVDSYFIAYTYLISSDPSSYWHERCTLSGMRREAWMKIGRSFA